jgi:ribonuclease VapC
LSGLVVDTSALVAVINGEPEAISFVEKLVSAERICVSTATIHELNCVMQRYRRSDGPGLLRGLLERLRPEMIAFDSTQLKIACEAYAIYGRGSKHPAGLNMADCYSFALAKMLGLPLLFKGNDFIHTNIHQAHQQIELQK